jgi:deoxyhypusine synthase
VQIIDILDDLRRINRLAMFSINTGIFICLLCVQIIDILDDLRRINRLAMFSINTGMIILGGGVIKHHICNANLMRNGADFRFVRN